MNEYPEKRDSFSPELNAEYRAIGDKILKACKKELHGKNSIAVSHTCDMILCEQDQKDLFGAIEKMLNTTQRKSITLKVLFQSQKEATLEQRTFSNDATHHIEIMTEDVGSTVEKITAATSTEAVS